jgi:hypothetical protein
MTIGEFDKRYKAAMKRYRTAQTITARYKAWLYARKLYLYACWRARREK